MENNKIEKAINDLILALGYDINNPNFKDTPKRVRKFYEEILKGEKEDVEATDFPSKYDGIILFKQINALSICPHHLLPIKYEVDVAYIPQNKVVGLSKVPRIVKNEANKAILQEDFTNNLIKRLEYLNPKGLAVIVRGWHGCMIFRGIKEPKEVITSRLTGPFYDDEKARSEFYQLIK